MIPLVVEALLFALCLFGIVMIAAFTYMIYQVGFSSPTQQRFRIQPVAMGSQTIWQIHERRSGMPPVFLGYRYSKVEAEEFVTLLQEARAGV